MEYVIVSIFPRRYQKELVAATERQNSLERAKVQTELDWQRRHEGLERTQFERSEDLVKSLAQARDEVRRFISVRDHFTTLARRCSNFGY